MKTDEGKQLIGWIEEKGVWCPMPNSWNKLWNLLPGKYRIGSGWVPALPLILAAWHETGLLQKKLRFLDHISWAEERGVIGKIDKFLRDLPDEQWFRG